MSVERIIGIDFGTSTSLVKVKSYRDGKPVDGDPTSTQAVEFDNGRVTAPTLIRFAGEEVYCGQEAIPPKRDSELCSNFKLDLQSPDAAAKARAQELTRKYFRFLYEQYSGQSTRFGQFDTERTLVSYPAKWARETREFMLQAARDAGFKNVSGMDEPTAALYTVMVQESKRLVQQGYLTAGKAAYVLMIDMGAGTTDLALCKYTPGGQNRIIDTWPPAESKVLFGGREMDELLIQYLVEYLKKCDMPERIIANLGKNSLEDCKGWKENTVSSALSRNAVADHCAFVAPLLMSVAEAPPPFPAIDRAVLERYCKDYIGRYAELIAGAMAHARQTDPDFSAGDLSLVVLTGGHSQWYFAKDMLCCSLPGYEGGVGVRLSADQVVTLRPPQHTVSSGLVFSAQFPAPKAEPEPVRPKESALSHVLCLWVTESHTMAAYQKQGRLCLIKTSSGDSDLPPLVTSDSQAQIREDTLSWIKETAERESGYRMKETLIAVPSWFTMERFSALKIAAEHCNLETKRTLWEMDMAALSYCCSKNSVHILIYNLDGEMESVAAYEWDQGVLETLFNAGRKVEAGAHKNKFVSYALESFCADDTPLQLLFLGDAVQQTKDSILEQVKEAINLQPETISLEKSEVLAGTLIHAGIINGQVEDVLLLPAIPNRIYVQSDDWKEPLPIVEICTTYPTKKSQIFPIIGTERNSAVYFGKEKIADIPFEIGLPPEDEKEDNTERQVEITVNTEIDFSMGVELNFLNGLKLNLPLKNIDSKSDFRPYSMEGIKLAAQGKPVPYDNFLSDIFIGFFNDGFNDGLGPDTKVSTSLSLEEAARGCKREIVFGRIEHCPACSGAGKVGDSPCEVCAGKGTVLVGKTLEVALPAGIDDEEIIRVPGMGDVSKNGSAGNLLVTVYVMRHPVLKRKGDDIWCEVSITPEQAKNGTDVVVPTVDGDVSVKLQKGAQSGQTLRLKGKGIRRPEKSEPGHQFVKVLIAPSQEEK